MADSGVPLYVLQRVASHQDPADTGRYLHPVRDAVRDACGAFSAWRGLKGTRRRRVTRRENRVP